MPQQATDPFSAYEISLRDYWRVLSRRRFLICGVVGVVTIATVIFVLLQANIYQGQATLMPLGKPSGLSVALGELGGLLPLGGGSAESPAERILAVLRSRTLAENVIKELDLLPYLFPDAWDANKQQWQSNDPPSLQDGVQALKEIIAIESDTQTGIISIAAEHTNPELSAKMANQHINVLQRMLNENAFTLAKKNRLFIEDQLRATRQALAQAEEALRRFEKEYGIIELSAQAEASIDAIASLTGEIRAKEVQLHVIQQSVTGASQEATLLQEALQALHTQLAQLQQGTLPPQEGSPPHIQALLAFDEAPEIKLRYVRLQREVEIQNKLFLFLAQQLEQSKIEETNDKTAFQVLDWAIPPEKKVKPKRGLSVLLTMVAGTFLGVMLAFVWEYIDSVIQTPEHIESRLGLPLLVTVPAVPQPKQRRRRRRTIAAEAGSALQQLQDGSRVEALRYLHIRLRHREPGVQTVLLTSPGTAEDVAPVLVHLAMVAASAGEKTLLVDGNLRQPTLHRLLDCPVTPGLANVLSEPQEWHKGVQATTIDNLHLIPAGAVTPMSFAALEASVFDTLLAYGKETYDLILCAAPPVLAFSDAAVLSSKVDATCLVLTRGVSRLDAAGAAKTALESVQATVVGAILIDPDAPSTSAF